VQYRRYMCVVPMRIASHFAPARRAPHRNFAECELGRILGFSS
jgi:hypothetical protein